MVPGWVKKHTRLTCEQKFIPGSFAKSKHTRKSLFYTEFKTIWNAEKRGGSQWENKSVFKRTEEV